MPDGKVCVKCAAILDEQCQKQSMWYGYIHINDSIHAKRIASTADWEEAWKSDFVKKITRPFHADGREAAVIEIKKIFLEYDMAFSNAIKDLAAMFDGKVLVSKTATALPKMCDH